ncbi:MAG: hypothetical protein GXZ10_01395 [Gammaproteobacteria bacterium]|nr:hypothetical protein [Gammaproteobacteria bacterium]
MKPQEVRRTLRMLWWLQLSVAVLPVCLVPAGLFSLGQYTERVSLLFFVLALSLLFLNAKPFQRFKHAVIMVGQVRETAQEADAWQRLMHVRLRALWYACIPAWSALFAKVLGLDMPVVVLLTLATPVLFWLYRTPKQLS